MASSSEEVNAVTNTEADEGFDESHLEFKKKKSKPFKKLRNFFRGSSKKRPKGEGDVTLKSHSISALHTHEDGEDDDGGFKRTSVGLAGSRSISEDSIFKPEQTKEQHIGVLHGTAVSMERINTDFQSELFSKLKRRQLTDSDIDDGLPSSPPSTFTTADVVLGGGFKSVPAGGKSTSLESDRSLLSIDGSETEEDLFQSNWKSGVASVVTKRPSSSGSQSDGGMEVSDLDAVEMRTEKLSNEGAKHRISVKPKSRRAATKTSMRQKEKPANIAQLPGVKEESPTKISVGEAKDTIIDKGPNVTKISTTIPVGNPPIPRSEPRDIPKTNIARDDTDAKHSHSMSPISTSPLSTAMLQDVKLRPRPASGKFDGVEPKVEKDDASSELSNAFNKAKRFSKKYDEDGSMDSKKSAAKDMTVNVKEKEESKFGVSLKGVSSLEKKSPSEEKKSPIVESKSIVEPEKEANVVSPGMTGVSFVLKKEPLRPGASRQDSSEVKAGIASSSDKKEVHVATNVNKDISKSNSETPSKVTTAKSPLGSPEKLASPREDYKQKRQLRSKTLPEQPVPKEMLDKAKEAESQKPPADRLASTKAPSNDYDNVIVGPTSFKSKRASWAAESTQTGNVSAEPSWIAKAKEKQMEYERQEKGKESKESGIKVGKIAERATPQTNTTTSEKSDNLPAKSVSVSNTVTEKSNVQTNIKSWSQSYTAKPFEQKTNNVSSVKAPSVQSTKTASEKPLNLQVKPSPSAQSSIKPSVQPASRPIFDKPLSASVKEKVEKTDSSSTVKSGLTASLKTSSVTAKTAFDSKSVTQTSTRSFGVASTSVTKEPVKTSVASVSKEPIKSSVLSDNKKLVTDSKKSEEKKDTKSTSGVSTRSGNVFEKKTPDAGGVPAWKQKKNSPSQVKIEIIDKPDSKAEPNKTPKVDEKKPVIQREKPKTDTYSEIAANRPSRVLDMVKSFQKLQVT